VVVSEECLMCPAYTAGWARHYKWAAVGVSKVHDLGYPQLAGDDGSQLEVHRLSADAENRPISCFSKQNNKNAFNCSSH